MDSDCRCHKVDCCVRCNLHTLQVGAQFRDGFDGQIYTVKQELTHGPVHSMKRYMVEKKGESNPK